jgi:sugar lactone lactonase YvrE
MADGQLAINTASGSPGLFFKDASGNVVKIGPVHVGSGAPNVSPASGGTSGNSIGEQWLDNSGGTYVFKVWDGSAWRSESGEFVNVTGDTMTGSLTMGPAATLIFEGSVDDGFETVLTVVNPTADQTITLPNITGTVVTTGDTGTVTSTMIADGTIVNADVSASAAIAGTKISPDFGSQNRTSTGTSTAASFIPTSSGAPTNGLYLSAANTVALATNSSGKLFIDSNGRVGIGEDIPLDDLHIASTTPAIVFDETDAGTDEKHWRIRAEGSILRFEGVNDAFDNASSWLSVTRSAGARTADNIAFNTGTVERLRIDSIGRILIGSQGVSYATPVSTLAFPLVQTHVVGSAQAQHVIANWGAGTDVGPSLSLCRADSGAIGTYTPAIGSADVLGNIRFNGSDGIKFIEGVKISAVADGTWATDSGPTSLRFSTTPSGTAVVERLRVTASGRVGIGTNLGTWTPGATLDVRSGSDNTAVEEIAAFARPDGAVRASINKGVVSGNGISFGTTTNHPLTLRTNTTERIVISASGTTTLTSDASTSPFIVNIDASERARIDSSGRLLVGTSTKLGSTEKKLEVVNGTIGLANFAANAFGSALLFEKGRGTSVGTIVQANDELGSFLFRGDDGVDSFSTAAQIAAYVDGTPDADDMPGRLVLSTTPDGTAVPVERLRITSTGRVGLATTAPAALAHIAGNTIVSNVDLANASYDNISFSVAGQETSATGLFFSPDGRKMFVTGSVGDDVNEYTLSTPWNVSTATYVTAFSVSGQDSNPQDLYFRNDGKKLYIMGSTNDVVYQYSLSTPWSIASTSYDSISFAVNTQDVSTTGVFFKPDGLTLYMLGSTNDTVYQYTLSTAWNVSTAVVSGSFSVLAQENGVNAISFTADGSRMFIMGSTGDDVNIYDLTTPWDVTTSSFVTVFSVAAQETGPNGLFVKPDGTKFYIIGTTNDTVYQYTIPSATIDLTGTTNINGNINVAQNLTINGEIVGAGALTLSTADTGGTPTPRLNITADGKVGIGTEVASALLHLAGSNPTVHLQPSADTESSEIAFRNAANTQTRGFIKYTNTDDSLSFRTNLSERARIDSSGRLLVGTAAARAVGSATTPLNLIETTNATLGLAIVRNSSDTAGAIISLGKSKGATIGSTTAVINNDILGEIRFAGADNTDVVTNAVTITAQVDGTPGSSVMPGRLVFSTTASGSGSPTPRMTITSSGLVGVGTSSPSTLLHLSGSATTAIARIASVDNGASTFNGSGAGLELLAGGMNTTSQYTPAIKFGSTDPDFTTTNPKFGAAITAVAAQSYTSDTTGGMSLGFWTSPVNPGTSSGLLERLTITASGSVGVGTSSPESLLTLSQSGGPQLTLRNSNAASNGVLDGTTLAIIGFAGTDFAPLGEESVAASIRGVGEAAWTSTASSHKAGLAFLTQADSSIGKLERMRITNAGNVGIGTTSPGNELSLAGTGNATTGWSVGSEDGATSGGLYNTGSTSNSISISADPGNVGANSNISFLVDASERARIDSSGRMLVGTSSARTVDASSTTMMPQLQLEGLSAAASSFSIIRNEASSSSQPYLVLGKSRSGSLSGATAVVTNDALGAILFEGTDGTAMVEAASVNAEVDGTVASGVMPGRLIFSTTASGASSPSERFRITSDGVQCYNQSAPATYASGVTLTAANLKTGIVQYSGGTATLTLPTGSGVESGFTGIYTNMTFDWSVINTGSGICTVGSGIGHTVTGSAIVSSGASGRFATRRTAANVFVSYRLS